jgi:DNA-binding CsgD family transcriptional regulator
MEASVQSGEQYSPDVRAHLPGPDAGIVDAFTSHLFKRSLQAGVAVIVAMLALAALTGALTAASATVGASLLILTIAALRSRKGMLGLLAHHPRAALLFPVPVLLAIAVDGGIESRWTPLVAVSVVIPALLGHPRIALACAGVAASGQAIAVLISANDVAGARVAELLLFNATGTIAAALGVALSMAVLARSLREAPAERLQADQALPGPVARPAALLDKTVGDGTEPAPSEPLSPSELRVVELLAAGDAPKEIAVDLGIAVATVRTHLKRAKRKTGARTLSELAGAYVAAEGRL